MGAFKLSHTVVTMKTVLAIMLLAACVFAAPIADETTFVEEAATHPHAHHMWRQAAIMERKAAHLDRTAANFERSAANKDRHAGHLYKKGITLIKSGAAAQKQAIKLRQTAAGLHHKAKHVLKAAKSKHAVAAH